MYSELQSTIAGKGHCYLLLNELQELRTHKRSFWKSISVTADFLLAEYW